MKETKLIKVLRYITSMRQLRCEHNVSVLLERILMTISAKALTSKFVLHLEKHTALRRFCNEHSQLQIERAPQCFATREYMYVRQAREYAKRTAK